ncbi:MAG: 4-hydroxythreonine-4-phosphate dehydrogenase PdxA [Armatimonadota bacterium]|nr:4-hydroxythreonine-4-phosphate dehydrogenase PdxA [Armatimonadota bacterium]
MKETITVKKKIKNVFGEISKMGNDNAKTRQIIGITIGDPAGIGPEIVLGALQRRDIYKRLVPVVIGSLSLMRRVADVVGIQTPLVAVSDPQHAKGIPGTIEIVDVIVEGIQDIVPGKVQAIGGRAADAYIRYACELALWGKIDAIVTAPISKESLRFAGVEGIGHTEMLADYLDAPNPLTLFITEKMRIFFLSRHLSLKDAIDYITEERLVAMLQSVNNAMKELGFESPRIGVAALNPHASDGGQFGDEEEKILTPAIEKARAMGINAHGPVGADSIFHQALEGKFDCVISLYHDQGHIAAKTRDFYRTVSATLGLPVLRTSVDHGTAFDIAWQGKANPVSMEAAIIAAADLLELRKHKN